MKSVVLKLLKQESVKQSEWHDLFYDVHVICLWDENGHIKLKEFLKNEIFSFVKEVQQVRIIYLLKCN